MLGMEIDFVRFARASFLLPREGVVHLLGAILSPSGGLESVGLQVRLCGRSLSGSSSRRGAEPLRKSFFEAWDTPGLLSFSVPLRLCASAGELLFPGFTPADGAIGRLLPPGRLVSSSSSLGRPGDVIDSQRECGAPNL